MNKLWLRKMIWSYIPLFLVMFTFLFFIFFQTMVEQNRNNMVESTKMFTTQLMQSVDVSLKTVDHMVIRELMNSKELATYFEQLDGRNVYLNYEVLKTLNELKQEAPLIDSFYLYRYNDKTILSGNTLKNLYDFEDERFARSMIGRTAGQHWSKVRSYRELPHQSSKNVVSLAYEFPVNSGTEGMCVVNIDVSLLRSNVSALYDPSGTFVNIFDGHGQPIYLDNGKVDSKILASMKSDYTGWTIESGMNNGLLVSTVSAFSNVWFAVGVLVFAAGLLLVIYITRANYKPIEQLVVKLNHSLFEENDSTGSLPADEFAFIESAINNFAAQSKFAAKEFSEAAVFRRKHAFNLIIADDDEDGPLAESLPFEGLQLPSYSAITVIVIEIDNPEQMFFPYSPKDRSLYKFVLSSVVNELMQQRQMSVWLEWTSPIHLTGIVFQQDSMELAEIGEAMVGWVAKNLKFTVTVGIGRSSGNLQNARQSYHEARWLLNFKAVLGNNRLIRYTDADHQQHKENQDHLRTIHELALAYRQGDGQWRSHFKSLVEGIRAYKETKPVIVKIFGYLLGNLELMLSNRPWEEAAIGRQALEDARRAVESFDTLDELGETLYAALEQCNQSMHEIRTARQYHGLMQDVKAFIEREYANADLSLHYLSDKFAVAPKYLSQLFKEAFGENFLDFLMAVRIRRAKEELLQGEDSIQTVGEKVGYPNAATFRRVFRKMEGLSPQDFRSRMQGQEDDGAARYTSMGGL